MSLKRYNTAVSQKLLYLPTTTVALPVTHLCNSFTMRAGTHVSSLAYSATVLLGSVVSLGSVSLAIF